MSPSVRKVFTLLQQAGTRGVTTNEFLSAYIARFSARIHDLQTIHGCLVESERLRDNQYRYTLTFIPDDLGATGGSPADRRPQGPTDSDADSPPRDAAASGSGAVTLFEVPEETRAPSYADPEWAA